MRIWIALSQAKGMAAERRAFAREAEARAWLDERAGLAAVLADRRVLLDPVRVENKLDLAALLNWMAEPAPNLFEEASGDEGGPA